MFETDFWVEGEMEKVGVRERKREIQGGRERQKERERYFTQFTVTESLV
jgi:hypothetical protein